MDGVNVTNSAQVDMSTSSSTLKPEKGCPDAADK